ncbi:hypothetical protein ACA910_012536 [Epithemia clementina (nom. ined.)]
MAVFAVSKKILNLKSKNQRQQKNAKRHWLAKQKSSKTIVTAGATTTLVVDDEQSASKSSVDSVTSFKSTGSSTDMSQSSINSTNCCSVTIDKSHNTSHARPHPVLLLQQSQDMWYNAKEARHMKDEASLDVTERTDLYQAWLRSSTSGSNTQTTKSGRHQN